MSNSYATAAFYRPKNVLCQPVANEPRRQKTGLRGFRPGPTQTGLCSHRRWLETRNFGFRKQRECTIRVAKTKTLICVFVFAYAKIRFSIVVAQIMTNQTSHLYANCSLFSKTFADKSRNATISFRTKTPKQYYVILVL